MSATQALGLAASKMGSIHSFRATMTITSGGTLATNMTGTLEEQVKPTVLAHQTFSISSNGQSIPGGMETLLTGNAVYLKISSLARQLGHPWVKVSFASLKHSTGISLAPLIHQLQGNNPLAESQMLSAAKNVHQVGSATVNGVPTTVYTGTLNVAEAMSKLDPSLRKLVGPMMSATGITTAHFTAWVDGQHVIRKIAEKESGSGFRVSTLMMITSINQPVHVNVPPASQVTTIPGM